MPITEDMTGEVAAMSEKPVRLETVSNGVGAPRLFMVLTRLFLVGLGVWVILPQPRVLPEIFWSAASFDRNPSLGHICNVAVRIGLFAAFAASLSYSCFMLWFNFVNVRRRMRFLQTEFGGLVVGRAAGMEERIPFFNIGKVMVRSSERAALASVTVITATGRRIGLHAIADADAVDNFCAECARNNVPLTRETRTNWRSAAPFLAAGPVLVMVLLVVRFALKW